MATTTAPTIATTGPVATSSLTRTRGAVVGSALTLGGNAVAYLLGSLGEPVRIVTGWEPNGADLRFADVAMASVTWVIIGAVALWLVERFRADGFRLWSLAAGAVAVLSIVPLFGLDVDAGSKLVLAVMHLVVGASAIAGQTVVRRRV